MVWKTGLGTVAGRLLVPFLMAGAPSPLHSQIVAPIDSPLLWGADGVISSAGSSAVRLLRAAGDDGLDPTRYDAELFDRLSRVAVGPGERARRTQLLTARLRRFLHDLRGGGSFGGGPQDLDNALRDALAADTLAGLVAALTPRLAQYRRLRHALAAYRLLAEDSTLRPLPAERTVHPGEPYAEAGSLERMLSALGDLPSRAVPRPSGEQYDTTLVAAVRAFQARHGLVTDGVLGPDTFRALNTPVRRRARQLELALERLRRLPPLGDERVIVVNVPAFRLFALESATAPGPPALTSRVVVGRAIDARTPALHEELRFIDFWPDWNVPRSILRKEILPVLRRRPDYLRRNRMEMVDTLGRVVGDMPTAEMLERLEKGGLRIRQRAGPGNALGAIKLVFPNAADVYLHGTPRVELFQRPRRDLSHGCIRVEDVSALATWVLRHQDGWTADSTAAAISAGRRRRVTLVRPLPVLLFYTTAAAAADGRVFFYEDLYKLDPGLDAELRVTRPVS